MLLISLASRAELSSGEGDTKSASNQAVPLPRILHVRKYRQCCRPEADTPVEPYRRGVHSYTPLLWPRVPIVFFQSRPGDNIETSSGHNAQIRPARSRK